MYENKYPLHEYKVIDGRVFYSYVQEEIWSSGPVIFLALMDENKNPIPESLWTEEEMEHYL